MKNPGLGIIKEGIVVMKTKYFFWVFIVLCYAMVSCTQEETKKGPALAKINDYILTLDEFQDAQGDGQDQYQHLP
jgi:hypothetical protein